MKNKVGIRTPKKDKKGNKVAQSGIRRRLKWEQEPQSGTRMKNKVGTRAPKWDKKGNEMGLRTPKRDKKKRNKNPEVGQE